MKTVTKIGGPLVFPTPKHKLRVAAYCRVSTDSEEQLVSLATQRKHYEAYITANPDWEFAGIYYDEGITGTKKEKRPALLHLIDDCEHKKNRLHCDKVYQPVCPQYYRLSGTGP